MQNNQLSYDVETGRKRVNLSRRQFYEESNAGRLRTFTVGRRRFVSEQALQDFVSLRETESKMGAA